MSISPEAPRVAIVGMGKAGEDLKAAVRRAERNGGACKLAGTYDKHRTPRPADLWAVTSFDKLAARRPDIWAICVPAAEEQARVLEDVLAASAGRRTVVLFASQRSAGLPDIDRERKLEGRVSFMYGHLLTAQMPQRMTKLVQQIGAVQSVHICCERRLTEDAKGRSALTLLSDPLDLICAMTGGTPLELDSTAAWISSGRGSALTGLVGLLIREPQDRKRLVTIGVEAAYGADSRRFEIRCVGDQATLSVREVGSELTVEVLHDDHVIDSAVALERDVACDRIVTNMVKTYTAVRDGRALRNLRRQSEVDHLIAATLEGLKSAADNWQLRVALSALVTPHRRGREMTLSPGHGGRSDLCDTSQKVRSDEHVRNHPRGHHRQRGQFRPPGDDHC